MIHCHGHAETGSASLYLTKLCKHFRHKVQVEFDEHRADIDFPFGQCQLLAEAQQLRIEAQAPDQQAMERIRFVIDDHLVRFARKENLSVHWHDGPAPHAGNA